MMNDQEYSTKATCSLSIYDSVRKRPGMYFGNINSLAVNEVICSIVDYSLNLYQSKRLITKIVIEVFEDIITVSDDGPGLPFDKPAPEVEYSSLAEYEMVNQKFVSINSNSASQTQLIGNNLGLAIINSASEFIKVKSSNGSFIWSQVFGKGKVLAKVNREKSVASAGTQFEIKLDKEIFQSYKADIFLLKKTLFELVHFNPRLIVEFQGERFVAPNGLLDLVSVYYLHDSKLIQPNFPSRFSYSGSSENIRIQVAAIGDTGGDTDFMSWVNGKSSVEGGTHVEGVRKAFKTVDWNPKLVLVNITMTDARFSGSVKDMLISSDVTNVVEDLLAEALRIFRNS